MFHSSCNDNSSFVTTTRVITICYGGVLSELRDKGQNRLTMKQQVTCLAAAREINILSESLQLRGSIQIALGRVRDPQNF